MKNANLKLLVCLVVATLVFSVMAIGTYADDATVAKIGDTEYTSLASAIEAAVDGDVITLEADGISENVTVARAADVDLTIDGNGKTFNGTITIDGKSATYKTGSLTIKNVNFDATGISKDACINFGVSGNNNTRYITNVTIEDCTFTGGNRAKAAIKSYTGGDKNIAVVGCDVDNTMHSILQMDSVDGLEIDGCTVESKNGINLNSSTNVVVKNSDINVSGYALRAGQSGSGAGAPVITLTDNTIHTDGSEGDAAIIIRGTASKAELSMEKNAVTTEGGVAHIAVSGMSDASGVSVAADANYWGEELAAPVADGFKVNVTNSYSDADCTDLVEGGNAVAYIGDAIYFSFEEALAAAVSGDVIVLANDLSGDFVLVRAADFDLTIDGNGKTFNGSFTIDGKSATYKTGSLTIKNVNFDATGVTKAACINFGGSNATRYITNVTIENCTFTGGNRTIAAVKSTTGGD